MVSVERQLQATIHVAQINGKLVLFHESGHICILHQSNLREGSYLRSRITFHRLRVPHLKINDFCPCIDLISVTSKTSHELYFAFPESKVMTHNS